MLVLHDKGKLEILQPDGGTTGGSGGTTGGVQGVTGLQTGVTSCISRSKIFYAAAPAAASFEPAPCWGKSKASRQVSHCDRDINQVDNWKTRQLRGESSNAAQQTVSRNKEQRGVSLL